MKKFFLIALVLLLPSATAWAEQCEDLIFRLTQDGNHEQSFAGGEVIVLQPRREGHLRVYLRSRGPIPQTLSAEYGHPKQFGLRGEDPLRVRRVIQIEPQKPNNIERGRVVFKTLDPGTATLGYRITGGNDPTALQRIPRHCRTGVLTLRVQRSGPPEEPHHPPAFLDVTGSYSTDYGELILQQEGKTIHGSFDSKRGHLIGVLEGQVLRGTWVQSPTFRGPHDVGEMELVFREGGRRFTGAWRRSCDQSWEAQWNGWRTDRSTTIIKR